MASFVLCEAEISSGAIGRARISKALEFDPASCVDAKVEAMDKTAIATLFTESAQRRLDPLAIMNLIIVTPRLPGWLLPLSAHTRRASIETVTPCGRLPDCRVFHSVETREMPAVEMKCLGAADSDLVNCPADCQLTGNSGRCESALRVP